MGYWGVKLTRLMHWRPNAEMQINKTRAIAGRLLIYKPLTLDKFKAKWPFMSREWAHPHKKIKNSRGDSGNSHKATGDWLSMRIRSPSSAIRFRDWMPIWGKRLKKSMHLTPTSNNLRRSTKLRYPTKIRTWMTAEPNSWWLISRLRDCLTCWRRMGTRLRHSKGKMRNTSPKYRGWITLWDWK